MENNILRNIKVFIFSREIDGYILIEFYILAI